MPRLLLPPAVLLVVVAALASPTRGTNFVIFLADDMGWQDLHAFGHPTQERGPIDMMADNGIRFTQWYSAESICTPSRAALMTGRMPTRMGFPHGVFSPDGNNALPSTDPTVAELVRPRGYRTGMVGKWHLGLNNHSKSDGLLLPFHRGFDYVGHILPFSNHWACDESGRHSPKPGVDPATDKIRNSRCFVYRNTTLVQQPIDHTYLTETLVADATGFITAAAQAKAPFLFYFAFPQCHVSMFTNTSFTNTSRNGIFGDQIREMQWAVGEVLSTLEGLGIANDTLSFFTSDHGPHVELCKEGGNAGPHRGGKGDSSWEGGLKVPGIAYWPGTITPRSVPAVVSTMDVTATIADLTGATLPSHIMDGRSLAPLLMNKTADSPHEALFHYCGDTLMAVRYKQWKLRYYTEQLPLDNYSTVHCTGGWAHGEFFQGGWTCHGGSVTTNNPPDLMDVEDDPGERYPLLTTAAWEHHLDGLRRNGRVPDLPYYREIMGQQTNRYDQDAGADAECGVDPVTYPHFVTKAQSSHSMPVGGPDNLATCIKECCAAESCCAAVYQPVSRNAGEPAGTCKVGEPCCWQATGSACGVQSLQPEANGTVVVVRSGADPGPYADILKEIAAIVQKHTASMVRETLPGKPNTGVGPCCNQAGSTECTCNYPGPAP